MFKGVNGSLKILGPGFKFQPCINYAFELSGDDKQNWIEMLKILLQKLLNHANETSTKALFELFEVFSNSLHFRFVETQETNIMHLYYSELTRGSKTPT